jgi:membrane protein
MARPLAVLFDVDGTLIDSNGLHVEAWHEAFAASGFQIDRETIAGLIGMGGDQLVPAVLPGVDPGEQQRLIDRHGSIYKNRYLHEARPFPGAHDLVARAHGGGLKVVLASSSDEDEVDSYIDRMGIRPFLVTRTSNSEVETSKPAPDIFATALAKAGVSAERAVAVGDSPYDAESAAKAGLRTVGLLSGGFTRERLEGAGMIALFDDAADLLARFDASPLAGQTSA